jgi:DNA-binding IscR family transcriptional regulator
MTKKKSDKWNSAFEQLRLKEATPPAGSQSIEDIAVMTGLSEDKVRENLKLLTKAGKVEIFRGKKLTQNKILVPTIYYKLIK